jgi:hypothetical protein
MATLISSLSPGSLYWQIMAMWNAEKRHGKLYTTEQDQAQMLILMLNVKQVAAKVKDGGTMAKAMTEGISTAVNSMFNSMPGDDANNTVPPGWNYHHPGPNPYLVAAELTQYANTLTDPGALAECSAVIDAIADKLSVSITADSRAAGAS